MAPEDQGTWGGGREGHRRAGPGGSKSNLLRALGSHRGWCPGEGQSSRAGRGPSARPQGPDPTPAPPHPPAGNPDRNPGLDFPPSQKKSGPWVPQAGFFGREIRSPPTNPTLWLLSQEPGAGNRGAKSQPLPAAAWAGSEIAEARPGPARGTSAPATGPQHPLCPSAQEGTHLGLGTPRPGAGQARRVRAQPDPLLGHRAGAGSGRGTFLRWRGTGIRLLGRRAGGGQDRPTRQREQRERRLRAANARHTQPAGTPRGSALRGAQICGGTCRPDHLPSPLATGP